jgi:hypothetical protein
MASSEVDCYFRSPLTDITGATRSFVSQHSIWNRVRQPVGKKSGRYCVRRYLPTHQDRFSNFESHT